MPVWVGQAFLPVRGAPSFGVTREFLPPTNARHSLLRPPSVLSVLLAPNSAAAQFPIIAAGSDGRRNTIYSVHPTILPLKNPFVRLDSIRPYPGWCYL